MSPPSFLLTLPRECIGKSSSHGFLLYESADSLPWQHPDPQVTPLSLLTSPSVLDPLVALRQLFPGTLWTAESVIVPTTNPAQVFKAYESFAKCEISLDIPCVSQYAGGLKPTIKPALRRALDELAAYTGVCITVATNFVLYMYGTKSAIQYARYKLFVLLNHFYGYSILRVELPLSQQPLVAGANRQHLLTIFQQTGVNIYMPPWMRQMPSLNLNEVYLAGDKTQVVTARKLIKDVIIQKTDNLVMECMISAFVRDTLLQSYTEQIDELMRCNATFIQMPALADPAITPVRIMGTTKRSIESTVEGFMKLCGDVYIAEIRSPLQQTELMCFAANRCNVMLAEGGAVVYGMRKHIKTALRNLRETSQTDRMSVSVLMEQPVDLMDFVLGKKQGKISKIMSATRSRITVEELHELNFRLRLSGADLFSVLHAVELMEDELPAEKSLYIPEVYHKQVIGQGGQAIQMLMRKYNVYMRFANTTKDKSPNAFGDSRTDNVVIRCPAKNRAQIDRAANELQQLILDLASKHHCAYVRLTRNHRRLLLSSQSNALRDAEVAAGAAINLPESESRETQFVEISGQTEGNTEQAAQMLADMLPSIDYEFRIPWSMRFVEAVGPQSNFSEEVSTPLFLAMSAQVQAFERVQMQGDSTIYSQIVVSVQEEFDGECFDDISQVITSYLRMHNLDIVDKGKLRCDLIVEAHAPQPSVTQHPSFAASTPRSRVAFRAQGFPRGTRSPSAPIQAPQVSQLAQLAERSRLSYSRIAPGPQKAVDISLDDDTVSVPRSTPKGLPERPPMAPLQWNRNYDETPVKKRHLENEHGRNKEDVQNPLHLGARPHNNAQRPGNGRVLHRY